MSKIAVFIYKSRAQIKGSKK